MFVKFILSSLFFTIFFSIVNAIHNKNKLKKYKDKEYIKKQVLDWINSDFKGNIFNDFSPKIQLQLKDNFEPSQSVFVLVSNEYERYISDSILNDKSYWVEIVIEKQNKIIKNIDLANITKFLEAGPIFISSSRNRYDKLFELQFNLSSFKYIKEALNELSKSDKFIDGNLTASLYLYIKEDEKEYYSNNYKISLSKEPEKETKDEILII